MRAVIQRVARASVAVGEESFAAIGHGLLVLLGVASGDGTDDADWMADKIASIRIFENAAGKFDESVRDRGGAVLVVSQFTLYADTRKGRRPSFSEAAAPEIAERLYQRVAARLEAAGVPVSTGRFGARMQVSLLNDGPVTVILDSPGGGA